MLDFLPIHFLPIQINHLEEDQSLLSQYRNEIEILKTKLQTASKADEKTKVVHLLQRGALKEKTKVCCCYSTFDPKVVYPSNAS